MRLPEIHRYGQVFNFVADNIHCWADAEGAQVWEVGFEYPENPFPSCRVLSFQENQAKEVASSWEHEHYGYDES